MRPRPGWPHGLWLLLAPAIAAAAAMSSVDHETWTTKYDGQFRKYSKHYFGPALDWRWFKAQAITESTLRPNARNPSGATGLMQILPSTFEEIRRKNPHFKSLKDPRWNIAAGIYYDRQLYKRWSEKVPDRKERLRYAFASYNAGFGRVHKAYRKAAAGAAAPRWRDLAPLTPKETRLYVKKLHRLMRQDI
jgi:membrane-bound lytic murein transglycosylase F